MNNKNKGLSYALYTGDIEKAFDNKVNIIEYTSLQNYNNIDDLLKPYGRTIVLYEFKPNSGHWTLITKIKPKHQKEYIEVFDSYGLYPTSELEYVPYHFKKLSDQKRKYLLLLLARSKLPIHYNQYKFQKHGANISTCGRWCILRGLLDNLNEKQFWDVINDYSKKHNISLDEASVMLTNQLIG